MTITAYLVEVEKRTIRAVTIDPANTLSEIRNYIGCDLIDMVRVDRHHAIVVDDNGLLDELTCFTMLKDFGNPLAGNLLVVGNDSMGETRSPTRPIEDFAAMLTIRFPVITPVMETVNGPSFFSSSITGFEVSLKEAAPAVVTE
ncbi:DUF3846 domain-containing protein [Agrobacterium tumefaciens]|uniref:DUF3846 domain-containing protein n=1 Tax=Agrobacterium tumefaciens TaxID=358 RepID=UPI001571CCAC|nr:DUF3846 domain-containing protein [Agrobacterium tumefaciens]MCZ7497255.1 DUF3846 domain-containing protein [Rhizobium rhizogenes]NTE56472.1 DUF3846 domain-containing protein [Agrobacterium tumefaciens]NTE74440.1 DUF3846 domain-containing protein [Agrobacterium tumefaciens]